MGIWYDKKAYQLLKKCSDAKDLTEWNEHRKATNYTPINLRFADLRDFYLKKAELQYVDLRGARLERAEFYLANTEEMRFSAIKYFWMLIGFFFLIYILFLLFLKQNDRIIFDSVVFFVLIAIGFFKSKSSFIIVPLSIFIGAMSSFIFALIYDKQKVSAIHQGILMFLGIPYSDLSGLFEFIMISSTTFLISIYVSSYTDENEKINHISIRSAKNPEKAIGFDRKYLDNKTKSVVQELEKEATELNKSIESTQDDEQKQKLVHRLEKLEEKIQFYDAQEEKASLQKTQIENVIGELQAPYKYIHQTITKIEWHNRIYYSAIFGLAALFLYAIANGYIDQRVISFTSLFTKDIQPTFGTIFGVILFYGTPVLLGISLIIYFIAQINKNIDKITELQEQERNIKQIASTIKAKAQIGMSDEEFVKETKNLIQKYQEGMMAGMFNKEKIADKEDKSSPSTYREKMIANGMSKLLMQALKK
ncbi:MAG: pentapeptide repeat-containing protein [Sulfuricurvum sp.]|nr:pentapeptide repeat-containing protein [Sulfuricurvum sp.]